MEKKMTPNEIKYALKNDFWGMWDTYYKRPEDCPKCQYFTDPRDICFLCVIGYALEQIRRDI